MTPSYHVVLSTRAEADLDDIYAWIATSSGKIRARSVIDQIVKQCRGLDLFPHRGTPREDLFPGLRIIAHRDRATIAFTVAESTVTIQSVLWRGRDAPSVFGQVS